MAYPGVLRHADKLSHHYLPSRKESHQPKTKGYFKIIEVGALTCSVKVVAVDPPKLRLGSVLANLDMTGQKNNTSSIVCVSHCRVRPHGFHMYRRSNCSASSKSSGRGRPTMQREDRASPTFSPAHNSSAQPSSAGIAGAASACRTAGASL